MIYAIMIFALLTLLIVYLDQYHIISVSLEFLAIIVMVSVCGIVYVISELTGS